MAEPDVPATAQGFSKDDEEARERFGRFRAVDPYPEIAPALLNSADIYDYVRVTGMIHPFYLEDLSKPACYRVRLDSWIEYDEATQRMRQQNLGEYDLVVLSPNGIAFVLLEPTFRIPEYLALRFNLTIVNVHRGLLVGTGPLVDPGFEGKLLLPLHNLTANEYSFRAGEGLVWFEFSKLSHNKRWQGSTPESKAEVQDRRGEYIPFPDSKKIDSAWAYVQRAHPSGAIRSSIPAAAEEARQSAEESRKTAQEAARSAEDAKGHIARLSLVALIGILIAAAGLVFTFYSLLQNDRTLVHELQSDRDSLSIHVEQLESRLRIVEREIGALRDRQS